MAEFCKECLEKVFECKLSEKDVVIDEDLELCEDCGEWKPCVIVLTKRGKIRTYLAGILGEKNILRKILRL